jgi:hypothetical protein
VSAKGNTALLQLANPTPTPQPADPQPGNHPGTTKNPSSQRGRTHFLAAAEMTAPGGPLLPASPLSLGAMLAMSHPLASSTGFASTRLVRGARLRWKGLASCFVASGRRKPGAEVPPITSRGGGRSIRTGPAFQALHAVIERRKLGFGLLQRRGCG